MIAGFQNIGGKSPRTQSFGKLPLLLQVKLPDLSHLCSDILARKNRGGQTCRGGGDFPLDLKGAGSASGNGHPPFDRLGGCLFTAFGQKLAAFFYNFQRIWHTRSPNPS